MDEHDTVPMELSWPELDASAISDEPEQVHGFKDTRAGEAVFRRQASAIAELAKSAPSLHRLVTDLWGTKELDDAFGRWLMSEPRLPTAVAEALLHLSEVHGRTHNFLVRP